MVIQYVSTISFSISMHASWHISFKQMLMYKMIYFWLWILGVAYFTKSLHLWNVWSALDYPKGSILVFVVIFIGFIGWCTSSLFMFSSSSFLFFFISPFCCGKSLSFVLMLGKNYSSLLWFTFYTVTTAVISVQLSDLRNWMHVSTFLLPIRL